MRTHWSRFWVLLCGLLWALAPAGQQSPVERIEKRISPHLVLFQEISVDPPLAIQGVRITPARAVSFRSTLGNDVVAVEGALRGRELTSRMAWRHRAIAAINADFFDGGDPLGLCILDGEIVSETYPGRPAVGWTATGQVIMGTPMLDGDITRPDGAKHVLMGLNRVAKVQGDMVLFNAYHGATAQATGAGTVVVLDALPRPLRVGAQVEAVVREVRQGSSAPIPPAGGVLIGTAGAADFLRPLQPGDRITIRVDLKGERAEQFRAVREAVAGGPWLVRDGKIVPPNEMPGDFNLQTFIERRHPRTAVGRTAQGEVLWITVDGRQPHSQGVSLSELAQIMARYGAVEAVNLDGGGSTTLVARNLIINSPSDGTERPVSNAWLVYDDAQRPTPPRYTDYRIDPPQASLKVNEQIRFRILRGDQPVSTWEAVWGTANIGFVDQWGRFRALRAGRGVVSAYIDGQWLHAPVEVIGDAPPQTQGGSASGN
jgi:hypothetical protein